MRPRTLRRMDVSAVLVAHTLAYWLYFVGVPQEASWTTWLGWLPGFLVSYVGAARLAGLYQSESAVHGWTGAGRALVAGGLALGVVVTAAVALQPGPFRPMPLTSVVAGGLLGIGAMAAVRWAAASSMRQFVQRLAVTVVSTVFAMVGLEVVVRAAYPKPWELTVDHPLRSQAHHPNSTYLERMPLDEFEPVLVHFNSLGLREDREIPLQKGEREFRILLLGDSYIEARQVPFRETIGQQMESRLNAQSRPQAGERQFTVINAGVSGYSPAVEYTYLKYEGLALHPDLVLVYFAFNDVTDDYRRYRETMEVDGQGLPIRVGPRKYHWRFKYQWFAWSRTAELLRHNAARLRQALFGASPGEAKVQAAMQPYLSAGQPTLTTNGLAVFQEDYDEVERQAWEDTKRYLGGIWSLLRANDIPGVLVAIPASCQVSADQWKVGKLKWGMRRDEMITSTILQQILRAHATSERIPFLDLLPPFRARAQEKLFYDYDGHWTTLGHQLAAEATLAFLRTHDVLE